MRPRTLAARNLAFYWRTNLAVVLGVATAVAVLSGALLVGDSVRGSLRDLFLTRLGNADYAISAESFFDADLAGRLASQPAFTARFQQTAPLIALEGFVIHEARGRRASRVQVFGVDDRFWRFHGIASPEGPASAALPSEALARELESAAGDALILRVDKPSDIPREFLHGRKEDAGRAIRLTSAAPLPAGGIGEFTLQAQQGEVRALFVPIARLQRDLSQPGRANLLLVQAREPRDAAAAAQLRDALKEAWSLADAGIRVRVLPASGALSVEKQSTLVDDALARQAEAAAAQFGLRATPVFTYLANTIRANEREVPYSLVTALPLMSLPIVPPATGRDPVAERAAAAGADGPPPAIVLNDWTARELNARPGDDVTLDYFVWREHGRLETASANFVVAAVLPIAGLAAARDLAPEYPGITEARSFGDWDPPFPLDLRRIRPQDEAYWDQHRTTPKAFIALEQGQKLWETRFGRLSSVRIEPVTPAGEPDLRSLARRYEAALRDRLDPAFSGFAVAAVRAEGLRAAQGATDFGLYFLYFSFFLVASGVLLAGLFFRLGVEQRLREIGLLRAFGFPPPVVRNIFLMEGIVLAAAGCVLGAAGGIGYGLLVIAGLKTLWVDAVGTRLLTLHVSPVSLAIGAAAGLATAVIVIAWVLRSIGVLSPRSLLSGSGIAPRRAKGGRGRFATPAAAGAFVGAIVLLAAGAAGWMPQVAAFFGAGTLLLIAFLAAQWLWLARGRSAKMHGAGTAGLARLGFRNATARAGRSVLCIALIAAATFIIVAVEAFRKQASDETTRASGTGGFALVAESLVPLFHDPNTAEGRSALNLGDDEIVRQARVAAFRLRPGDDASCLNLYRPQNPRVLGAPPAFVDEGRFAFQDSLATTDEEKRNPWLLLNRTFDDGAIPAIADATSLTYVLHRKLGEDIEFGEGGRPVRLRLVGALRDSVFQRDLVVSEGNFLRAFPGQEGFRFFLVEAPGEKLADVSAAFEDRLSDYGFDATDAARFLAGFHRVENTYLSTFQMLGGLGLLLGTIGLAAVLLRNVLERRRELALLRAVGYRGSHIAVIVLAENLLLLAGGLLTGAICAMVAVAPAFVERGGQLHAGSAALVLAAVLVTGLVASVIATRAALRSPLLAALRSE